MSAVQSSSSSDPYSSQIAALEQAAGNNPQYDQQLQQWQQQIEAQQKGAEGESSDSSTASTPAATPASSTTESAFSSTTPAVTATPSVKEATSTPSQNSNGSASDDSSSSGAGADNIPSQLKQYSADIEAASKATGLSNAEISGVIWDESRGVGSAATTNGGTGETDGGLMQVDPSTAQSLEASNPSLKGVDVNTDAGNIMVGASLLASEEKKYGSIDLAERAYNSGEGSVDTSNANVTTTGLGDPNYITKVDANVKDIESGSALPS